jgi:hypothetical protein
MASFSAPAWALRSLPRPVAGRAVRLLDLLAKAPRFPGLRFRDWVESEAHHAPPKQAARTAAPVSSNNFRASRFRGAPFGL